MSDLSCRLPILINYGCVDRSSGAPAVAFSWGMMPFGGYGYGGGYGGGLAPSYGGGGGLNIGSLLLFGIVAYFAVSALQSYFNNSSDTDSYGAPPPVDHHASELVQACFLAPSR